MVESYRQQSPLDHLALTTHPARHADDAGLILGQRSFMELINLRGDANRSDFTDAVRHAVKIDLPISANTAAGKSAGPHILWLGPDEWLIVAKPGSGERMATALRNALAGQHAAVTETGQSRTCITIGGSHARDVLAKGCALDLHPSAFGAGQCAQTLLAKAGVILHLPLAPKGAEPMFEIHVLRSFAAYLWAWLEDAAQEYGLRVDI